MHEMHPYKKGTSEEVEQVAFVPDPNSPAYKEKNKRRFLDQFVKHGTVGDACKTSGVNRSTVYRWRQQDAPFAEAFDEVNMTITDDLEGHALARAKAGSDLLTIFLLKTRNPERFNDKYMQGISAKMIDNLVNTLVDALRKNVPNNCPHCKTNLGLTDRVAETLKHLSERI